MKSILSIFEFCGLVSGLFLMFWIFVKFLDKKISDYTIWDFIRQYFLLYVMLAIFFAAFYHYEDNAYIRNTVSGNEVKQSIGSLSYYDAAYFSFVTLSTTGYGDIQPYSHIAKGISMLENLIGHFLTVFISGIIIAKTLQKPDKADEVKT